MNYEKAIAILKNGANAKTYEEQVEARKMGIEALEKQIPKKPIIREWSPARCPSCKTILSEAADDGYYKHWTTLKICECGQKLNWP